jgi:rRNA processing protein Krr1/Pno1
MEITIDIIDKGALRLLHDMEFLKLIKLKTPVVKERQKEKKMSERFAGTLHLSDEQYEEFQMTLTQGRNEWERNIY